MSPRVLLCSRRLGPSLAALSRRRHFGSYSRGMIGSLLKIRYLVMGSAVGGGLSLKARYEEWKDSLPDMSWTSKFKGLELRREDWEPVLNRTRDSLEGVSSWFNKRLENAAKASKEISFESSSPKEPEALSTAPILKLNIMDGFKKATGSGGEDGETTNNNNSPSKEARLLKEQHSLRQKLEESRSELHRTQSRLQKKLEGLEAENRELKRQLLLAPSKNNVSGVTQRKSLIDMYSDVLDELSGYDVSYSTGDCLPRVVVIGDQSAGKTSVLEAIARARLFPRGAGEMMTRSPVAVTLSEGPYHIARFKDAPSKEYDLTKEEDLSYLRREVEARMRASVGDGTISRDPISMVVQGPGLQRMVLVDLPGVISTVTVGMDPKARESIKSLAKHYMSNPNAIILCIQDGSVDAERSNVVDLVSEMDPLGKRTLLVLTKVDLAAKNGVSASRIQSILSGKLFPLKALGYFAVVTGKGGGQDDSMEAIRDHEEEFFASSKMFKSEISPSQITTSNLSHAVSSRFWGMVLDTIEQQADAFKASRFNLETEWRNSFPGLRELDREELFEKARGDILDEIVNLSLVPAKVWEGRIYSGLWRKMGSHVFENIYLPATGGRSVGVDGNKNDRGAFNTAVDIKLKQWAESRLGQLCVSVGWEALSDQFEELIKKSGEKQDPLFRDLKEEVVREAIERHKWENKATETLRVIQLNALEDSTVHDKEQWDSSIQFLESVLKEKLSSTQQTLKEQAGPTNFEKYILWKSSSQDHVLKSRILNELSTLYNGNWQRADLSEEEIATVKRNLEGTWGLKANSESVREVWRPLYRKALLLKALQRCKDCKKGFFAYSKGISTDYDCSDIVLFWRVQQMLKITANSLRQQVINRESKRFEKEIKEVLEEFSRSTQKKKSLLTGRRVTLAEDLKKIRHIQEKLESFIDALNTGQE